MNDPWLAAERFVSPDLQLRREGLAVLAADGGRRFSPLVVCLLASRLDEPDLILRGRIVGALARCFEAVGSTYTAPKETREFLSDLLSRLARPQMERLLEVAGPSGNRNGGESASIAGAVTTLLDRIPQAPALLTKIAADRLAAFPTRYAAIAALGELGALEALPALEGLKSRVEGQKAGQLAMAFAPPPNPGDDKLLDILTLAIEALREADQ